MAQCYKEYKLTTLIVTFVCIITICLTRGVPFRSWHIECHVESFTIKRYRGYKQERHFLYEIESSVNKSVLQFRKYPLAGKVLNYKQGAAPVGKLYEQPKRITL